MRGSNKNTTDATAIFPARGVAGQNYFEEKVRTHKKMAILCLNTMSGQVAQIPPGDKTGGSAERRTRDILMTKGIGLLQNPKRYRSNTLEYPLKLS